MTVTESKIANAVRAFLTLCHSLVEGAGAAGLAGVKSMGADLIGRHVGIVASGGNLDQQTLERVAQPIALDPRHLSSEKRGGRWLSRSALGFVSHRPDRYL